ncbi:MAG: SGNH/GDSL hydrolase family protein [Gammaproteobacteria bacterium]|nr:MAG: SGNH/GDSL hydrolase family protein [Gammaproteobacteria bacterium]
MKLYLICFLILGGVLFFTPEKKYPSRPAYHAGFDINAYLELHSFNSTSLKPSIALKNKTIIDTSGILGVLKVRPVWVTGLESNGDGYALNSQAPSNQLGKRSSVKILNNSTLVFEELVIGGAGDNTHIGHGGNTAGLWDETHGWQIQMANLADSGVISNPVSLIQVSQGGSTIANWGIGSYYPAYDANYFARDLLKQRLDTGLAQIVRGNGGVHPPIYMPWTHGINDIIAGTPVATWKAGTIELINWIRTTYPLNKVVVIMVKIPPSVGGAYVAYNSAIEQICSELPNVHYVEVADLTMREPNHFDDPAFRMIFNRIVQKLIDNGHPL